MRAMKPASQAPAPRSNEGEDGGMQKKSNLALGKERFEEHRRALFRSELGKLWCTPALILASCEKKQGSLIESLEECALWHIGMDIVPRIHYEFSPEASKKAKREVCSALLGIMKKSAGGNGAGKNRKTAKRNETPDRLYARTIQTLTQIFCEDMQTMHGLCSAEDASMVDALGYAAFHIVWSSISNESGSLFMRAFPPVVTLSVATGFAACVRMINTDRRRIAPSLSDMLELTYDIQASWIRRYLGTMATMSNHDNLLEEGEATRFSLYALVCVQALRLACKSVAQMQTTSVAFEEWFSRRASSSLTRKSDGNNCDAKECVYHSFAAAINKSSEDLCKAMEAIEERLAEFSSVEEGLGRTLQLEFDIPYLPRARSRQWDSEFKLRNMRVVTVQDKIRSACMSLAEMRTSTCSTEGPEEAEEDYRQGSCGGKCGRTLGSGTLAEEIVLYFQQCKCLVDELLDIDITVLDSVAFSDGSGPERLTGMPDSDHWIHRVQRACDVAILEVMPSVLLRVYKENIDALVLNRLDKQTGERKMRSNLRPKMAS